MKKFAVYSFSSTFIKNTDSFGGLSIAKGLSGLGLGVTHGGITFGGES